MGNCLFAGNQSHGKIKVITSNGGIMELEPPTTVGCIADEFPGHGIFKTQDLFWNPLPNDHDLQPGKSYYLLPTKLPEIRPREGHVTAPAYRMSLDYRSTEIWKVKLAITPKRLVEILEEDDRTRELIESVQTVAKCAAAGSGNSFSSFMAFSDHWNLSAAASISSPAVSSNSAPFLHL